MTELTGTNDSAPSNALLSRYAVFGLAVAFAGPPVYIHLPKVYAEQHGLGLATIGVVLLGLRAVDFLQDPLLGWLAARWTAHRSALVAGFAALLAVSMVALFTIAPPIDPVAWLVLSLTGVFTGFSGLQIVYYGTGVGLARAWDASGYKSGGHERIAAWRETGVLIGICVACVAPTLFGVFAGSERMAYVIYGCVFAVMLLAATLFARPVWAWGMSSVGTLNFGDVLRDGKTRQLLALGFVNAIPVGLTATLFLFYVEYRLEAGAHAGPMLLVFFASAALSASAWGKAAERFGAKTMLLCGMVLAIVSFASAWWLGPGDWAVFYVISAVSGVAVAADMTLLPALLANRIAQTGGGAEQAFSMWGFVNKSTLAIAAGTALPALAWVGFTPGAANSETALQSLSFSYAALPCLLKFVAIIFLSCMRFDEGVST